MSEIYSNLNFEYRCNFDHLIEDSEEKSRRQWKSGIMIREAYNLFSGSFFWKNDWVKSIFSVSKWNKSYWCISSYVLFHIFWNPKWLPLLDKKYIFERLRIMMMNCLIKYDQSKSLFSIPQSNNISLVNKELHVFCVISLKSEMATIMWPSSIPRSWNDIFFFALVVRGGPLRQKSENLLYTSKIFCG